MSFKSGQIFSLKEKLRHTELYCMLIRQSHDDWQVLQWCVKRNEIWYGFHDEINLEKFWCVLIDV